MVNIKQPQYGILCHTMQAYREMMQGGLPHDTAMRYLKAHYADNKRTKSFVGTWNGKDFTGSKH